MMCIVAAGAQGGNLWDAICNDAAKKLTWYRNGQRIALDIARGLCYLHSCQVRLTGGQWCGGSTLTFRVLGFGVRSNTTWKLSDMEFSLKC
jgi:hypothetical protein